MKLFHSLFSTENLADSNLKILNSRLCLIVNNWPRTSSASARPFRVPHIFLLKTCTLSLESTKLGPAFYLGVCYRINGGETNLKGVKL